MTKKARLTRRITRQRTARTASNRPRILAPDTLKERATLRRLYISALRRKAAGLRKELAGIDRELAKFGVKARPSRSVPYEVKPVNIYPPETLPPALPISTIPVTC